MNKSLARNVYVKKSGIQGYGVFADKDFFPGDIIEECYCLYLNEHSDMLGNHTFATKLENEYKDWSSLALGYGSIYNHSDAPNADCDFDHKHAILIFTALNFIRRGEEIFIYYGSEWFENRGLNKIQPLSTSSHIPVQYRIKKFYRDNKSLLSMLLRGMTVILSIKLVTVLAAAFVVGN